jgi:hypothetical protein
MQAKVFTLRLTLQLFYIQNGDTPLHQAASNCQNEVVILLLERGANPTIRNGVTSCLGYFNDCHSVWLDSIGICSTTTERRMCLHPREISGEVTTLPSQYDFTSLSTFTTIGKSGSPSMRAVCI